MGCGQKAPGSRNGRQGRELGPERLAASLAFADRAGTARYVALQPQYNLMSRDTYEGARRDIVQGWRACRTSQ
ncbi:hypothetical protein [Amycolatopsis coloradensis]|uniref:hypothetical protein n=1 Tax=Amycolatopsis coloradensis TaxID=76021 RepID=UPI003CC65942